MKYLAILAAGMFAALAGEGETLFDFAVSGGAVRVADPSSAYRKDAPEKQLELGPGGLLVRTDPRYENSYSKWMTLALPRGGGLSADMSDRRLRIVLAAPPQGRILSNLAVNLADRDGETFQVMRNNEEYNDKGEYCIDFDVRDRPDGKKGWGSPKADGIKNPPLRLASIALHFASGVDELGSSGGGSATFIRIEDLPRTQGWLASGKAAPREVFSTEPISVDTMYPGAAPFPGAKELRFKLEPAVTGPVTLTLSQDSMGPVQQGVMTTYTTMASNGVARFETKLPYETLYQFYRIESTPAKGAKVALKAVKAGGRFAQRAAEAMRLEVVTGNPLHLVREAKGERPCLIVRNPASRAIAWKVNIVLSDYFGREVKLPLDCEVKPGEEMAVEIPWPLPSRGLWRVKAFVEGDDGSRAVKEDRFAWLDLHEVTPKVEKPKFRMGIHYHGTRYLPGKVDLTIAALVAAGAKFTRCDYDHMWGDIEPKEGVWKWEKSDLMIDKLTAAGLALDIIFASTPAWAVDPKSVEHANRMKAEGYRIKGCCYLPREGLFRAFCEKYARRYGTRIDYYECGNEWDLTGTGTVAHSDLLRVQREAYEGLHAGCPDVCVTPNGWTTSVSSSNSNAKVWNIGLVEHFADHPETYDAWALHCHGTPESFRVNISERFLPMRAAKPLKNRPWLCNETAYTSANGQEDDVASAVWQKIVYAWAMGASDYIWYNLRATGWFEGGEPGYGLITPDFRPRAGYAAFSALSTILQGLDFDATIHSKGLRHLFRFRGTSMALSSGLAFVGWDTLQKDSLCRVEVVTDAKRAATVDLMGNRRAVPVLDGKVVFSFGYRPAALLLEGATKAEIVDRAPLEREGSSSVVVRGVSRDPQAVLSTAANVKDLYEANPAMVHRLWKGAADHSALVWIDSTGDGFTLRVKVRDDVRAPGDRLVLKLTEKGVPPRLLEMRPISRAGVVDDYRQSFRTSSPEVGLELKIYDDDGEGDDSYLFLTREGAGPLTVRLEATSDDSGRIVVDSSYPCGNVKVLSIDEASGVIEVAPDLRDTVGHWFHFDFTVRGAQGRSIRFDFPRDGMPYLSTLGPAICRDGKSWAWLNADGRCHEPAHSFTYSFAPDERAVRFALSIPYGQKEWEEFLSDKLTDRRVKRGILCRSQSGTRDVELLRVPCEGSAEYLFVFTSRHHACETTGNPPMEGALTELLSDSEEGRWARQHAECVFVPFMDKDGVENGDQGKNRAPWDYNRDYTKGRYSSVRALKELVLRESEGRQIVFLDLHSPYLRALKECPEQEEVFTIGTERERLAAAWNRFRKEWAAAQRGGRLAYTGQYDLDSNHAYWKKMKAWWDSGAVSADEWVRTLPNAALSTCCEFGYSRCGGINSRAAMQELGANMFKAAVRSVR